MAEGTHRGDHPETDEPTADEQTVVAGPSAKRRSQNIPTGDSLHDAPTQALPASRSLQATARHSTGVTGMTTATTPLEALHLEEVARTRIFLKIVLFIIIFVAVSLPVVGGDPVAKRVLYVGMGIGLLVAAWTLLRIRDAAGYRIEIITPVSMSLVLAGYTSMYYFGIFSGAPAVIVLGIYFFSLGGSKYATLAIYVQCAALQLALTLLITQDIVADRGLIRGSNIAMREQLAIQAIIQMLYFSAYWIGRRSRISTLAAIGQLEKAIRSVAQREALLLEAKQDLERALRIGGPGRFTEQQVGSFTLGALIGRGGMGEVYEATNATTGDDAAVKLLHPHVMANTDHVRRFVREAELASSIRSDHVVGVLEVGSTDGEVPYLAMERLRGRDLSHHLRKHRYLHVSKVVTLVRQVGVGLDAARLADIVHRDIKPQNLFLARVGTRSVWKILDFGVSKLAHTSGTLTKGHVVGTPGYMAPEQARGGSVDYRADLYGLGAIAFRALTGHPPFSGKDLPTTLYDVVYKMPTRPSKLHPALPAQVDLVLAVALAKKPRERFETPAEFANALAAAAKGELSEDMVKRAERLLSQLDWEQRT